MPCDAKKQACRWNKHNRKGQLVVPRAQKGEAEVKATAAKAEKNVAGSSTEVGKKRPRSKAIVESSEGGNGSGDEGKKEKEQEAESSTRPAKRTCPFLLFISFSNFSCS